MSDINYKPLDFANVHGTADEPISVTVDATVFGVWTISGHPNPEMNGPHTPPDGTHSDTVKFSNCSYIRLLFIGALEGGREDCVDINNGCHHIEVVAGAFVSGGSFVATIKGESYEISLSGVIRKEGRETDIDLGGWSDQKSGRTKGVRLNLIKTGGKVFVRVLHAWDPVLMNGAEGYVVNVMFRGWFHWIWQILKNWGWA